MGLVKGNSRSTISRQGLRCSDKLTHRDIPEANNFETRPEPISSKQMHGICSALGQAVNSQIFLWRIEVIKN